MVLELGEIDLECELKRQKGTFDKVTTRTFALEIGKGIKEMHDHSIIHLDMKLANILIVKGTLKIMDLGLSATLPENTDFIVRDFMFGSNRPPEQIVPQRDGTYKMIAILDPNVRIQHDLGADPVITEFFEMCTVREVEKRATIDQLLEHQYLGKASTTKASSREKPKAKESSPVKKTAKVVTPGGVTPQTPSTMTNPESGPSSLPELSERKPE
ncbi:hypothetical protein OESDEN_17405 [Oesophagostomum dentatum]|uniref:Protein kinase domain-containing protein n=1 Tax=Oesophagostomum dentatum TaxID=61180 RepID=A0A0B1SI54_OESDE|nr:hypothetical protein OESDEN_17405 [Oesophagostomum dentatum]